MSEKTQAIGRRGFLATLGFGATAAAAGAAVVTVASKAEAVESEDEKRKARYQVTDHVKAFYRVNKY
jgi:hypothetical protein